MTTQFFDAIRQGDEAQVRALLSQDPKLTEARTAEGTTPALWALYTRHAALAPIVLAGREANFYEACALGLRDVVASWLQREPQLLNTPAPDGFGALGLSIFFGHPETARLLVEAGADVNAPSRNSFRVTPLHSAVESGRLELLELLLTHGATPDPAEFAGATPLDSARARGRHEMVERLLAAGAGPAHAKTVET